MSSSDLFVMQTEFSIYVLLRFWVFLQLHPEWDSSSRESLLEAQQYFQNRKGEMRVALLSYMNQQIVVIFNQNVDLMILDRENLVKLNTRV